MKDLDDRLLANTFDPDDIKSRKSNKRREQEQLDEIKGKYQTIISQNYFRKNIEPTSVDYLNV